MKKESTFNKRKKGKGNSGIGRVKFVWGGEQGREGNIESDK